MASRIITVTAVDSVEILAVRVKKSTNELRIRLSRYWYTLSPALQDALFREANKLAEKRVGLKEGWSPNFYFEED